MNEGYEVVDVLMLVGNVGPLAVYFLILGLVNSHARPFLMTSRADFLALTSVLLPVLIWPVPDFIRAGLYLWLTLGLLLAVALFVRLLPGRLDGFVVYNVSVRQCVRMLNLSLRRLGLAGRWKGGAWTSDDGSLSVCVRGFAPLRNASIHVESTDSLRREWVPRIGADLEGRLKSVAQLPSASGAALVVAGVTLMILPMWMVGRHIHDLVDAMTHVFG